MSLESILHTSERTPTLCANDRLARMASYSAWLLKVLKEKCRDFSMRIWLRPSRTILAPAPLGLEEPSMYSVHWSSSRECWRSLTKSSRHWALMGRVVRNRC